MAPRPPAPIFNQEDTDRLIYPLTPPDFRMIESGSEGRFVASKRDIVIGLLRADSFVKALSTRQQPPDFVKQDDKYVAQTDMRKLILHYNFVNQIHDRAHLEEDMPLQIDPYLQAFNDAYAPLISYYPEMRGEHSMEETLLPQFREDNRKVFDKFISDIKKPEFKNRVNGARRRLNKNRSSLLSYIEGLISHWPALHVVRLTLGYPPNPRGRNYSETRHDFNAWLDKRHRHPLFERLAGFVWKLENVDERGYYYHVLLCYDGQRIIGDKEIEALRDLWIRDVTRNEGACYEYYLPDKALSKLLPDGLISINDTSKRQVLINWLDYLLKTDRLFTIDPPKGVRTFGKGQLPRKY